MKTWTFILTNKGFLPLVLLIKKTTTYFQHCYSQRLFLGTWFLHNRFAELCWNSCHYTVWESRLEGSADFGDFFFFWCVWVVLRKVVYDQAQNSQYNYFISWENMWEYRGTYSVQYFGACLMLTWSWTVLTSIHVIPTMYMVKHGLYQDRKPPYSSHWRNSCWLQWTVLEQFHLALT